MQSVVRENDIDIIPERFEKIYFHWIDNLRDWCVSRQIWWGHRIPVWYRHDTDGREEIYAGVQPPTDLSEGWNEWEQDPDTLDTWFSSALWTWSTLIDPKLAEDYTLSLDDLLKKSSDYQAYHPTTVMETGWDILFFWVARMVLTTTYVTGEVPFKTVYLHGLVRTEHGKKMSKSNPETIIDPLEVIPEYGTDALRFALIQNTTAGNDQSLGRSKIIANRNFANKIWNIARYIEDVIGENPDRAGAKAESAADNWVLSKLQQSQELISADLDNFRFGEAYDKLYHFVWDDFADWYIEASKAEPNKPLLAYLLEQILIIAHPFAPFLTETIWQTLAWENDSILASRQQEKIIGSDSKEAADFAEIQAIVTEARFITRALKVSGANLHYQNIPLMEANAPVIKLLARLKSVTELQEGDGIQLTSTKYRVWLDIGKDKAKAYVKELDEKRSKEQASIKQLQSRLSNKNYVQNAPDKVIQQTKDQLQAAQDLLKSIDTEIKRFSAN